MSETTERNALLGVYTQPELVLARGEGARVWDEDGETYLDFTSGIAVNALGHGSPVVADAIRKALDTGLVHTSNLFRTRPGEALAELLVEHAFPGSVFFCNSGAEANEAAFKFARRWARETSGSARHEIVAFHGSFHGRLFGSLAATDRPHYQDPFRPLMPGVRFADVGDLGSVDEALASGAVAAVIIEPLQAEGGIRPVPSDFLQALRGRCDEAGALLVFDEVQVGLGRTGRLFAFEECGVVPDILTLAKPLAGGLPMGATIVSDAVAATIRPGDHATTFGGGPLVASVALAVLREIVGGDFLERVRARSRHLEGALARLAASHTSVREVRGRGLIQGVELEGQAGPIVRGARESGLLLVSAGPDVIRLLPPLNVTEEEIDEGVTILDRVLTA